MTLTLKGDFRKALGFETIVLDEELSFELTKVSPKDVNDYQDIFFGKYKEDSEKFKRFRQYFIIFFKNHRQQNSDMTDEEIELLVGRYLFKLIEQFSISFKLVSKEKMDEAKMLGELRLKEGKTSPIDE